MNKWIITDHLDPVIRHHLERMDRHVDWLPEIEREELLDRISRYEGMVISSKTFIDRELIDQAGSLRIIARAGSGMEHVDRDYCSARGITCLSSPEGNRNAVAEHAFGMLLNLSNHLKRAHTELLDGIWLRKENRGFELSGRKVGIIGYGNTGSNFARKFAGWDVEVLAYDKYKSGFGSGHVREVGYDELLTDAGIISFHIPLSDETRHWISEPFIESCRPGVIILNTSRGGIMNTEDVLQAVRDGRIGGLGIDVFEDEPITSGGVHPFKTYRELLSFDNVIGSPHIAGWSGESKVALVEVLARKIGEELTKQGLL